MYDKNDPEPLYLGFFHTGAYQDALSGYGGIKHCLIPSPKHVVLYKNSEGNLVDTLYKDTQLPEDMLSILGYHPLSGASKKGKRPAGKEEEMEADQE